MRDYFGRRAQHVSTPEQETEFLKWKSRLEEGLPNRLPEKDLISELSFPAMARIIAESSLSQGNAVHNDARFKAAIVPPERIIYTTNSALEKYNGSKAICSYAPELGAIFFNVDGFRAFCKRVGSVSPQLLMMNVMFHEQGHAAAAGGTIEKPSGKTIVIGLQRINVAGNKEIDRTGLFLDEAANEKQARLNTLRYAQECMPGTFNDAQLSWLSDVYSSSMVSTQYLIGIHVLEEIITRVSEQMNMAPGDVFHKMHRARTLGIDITSKYVRRRYDLDRIFGRDFSRKLASVGSSPEQVMKFLKSFKLTANHQRLLDELAREEKRRILLQELKTGLISGLTK